MSLTLFLVRHAKSSWSDPTLADSERPLNSRGHRDAPVMAARMASLGYKPELYSSSANRALTTARYFAKELGVSEDRINVSRELYHASASGIVHFAQSLKAGGVAMLFGHNPGFTDAVNELTNSRIDNVPTCGVAMIVFEVDDWRLIGPGDGKLVSFDYPKKQSER